MFLLWSPAGLHCFSACRRGNLSNMKKLRYTPDDGSPPLTGAQSTTDRKACILGSTKTQIRPQYKKLLREAAASLSRPNTIGTCPHVMRNETAMVCGQLCACRHSHAHFHEVGPKLMPEARFLRAFAALGLPCSRPRVAPAVPAADCTTACVPSTPEPPLPCIERVRPMDVPRWYWSPCSAVSNPARRAHMRESKASSLFPHLTPSAVFTPSRCQRRAEFEPRLFVRPKSIRASCLCGVCAPLPLWPRLPRNDLQRVVTPACSKPGRLYACKDWRVVCETPCGTVLDPVSLRLCWKWPCRVVRFGELMH